MSDRHYFLCRFLISATSSLHRVPSGPLPAFLSTMGCADSSSSILGRLIFSPGGFAGARPEPKSGFMSSSKDF